MSAYRFVLLVGNRSSGNREHRTPGALRAAAASWLHHLYPKPLALRPEAVEGFKRGHGGGHACSLPADAPWPPAAAPGMWVMRCFTK